MTLGTNLTRDEVQVILDRIRGGASHVKVAADLGLSRHTVDRYARLHGVARPRKPRDEPGPRHFRRDTSWQNQSNCRELLGFTEWTDAAQQQVCEPTKFGKGRPDCPVKDACLEWGLSDGPPFGGVFGGKSPDELRRIWKARRREARAEVAS